MSLDVEARRAPDSGQARLEELGFKQDLRRVAGLNSNFYASLTLLSCLTNLSGSLSLTYGDGGPAAAVWGWIAISVANILMGVSIAELLSAYPVAGGPYLWCLELTENKAKWMLLAWLTGWINIVGQFGMTAVTAFLTAKHTAVVWQLAGGRELYKFDMFLMFSIILLLAGMAGSAPTGAVRIWAVAAGSFLAAAGALVITVLPMVAPALQPAAFVFLESGSSLPEGVPSDSCMFLLALPIANLAFMFPQAPIQLAEETRNAGKTGPLAMIWSVAASAALGLGFLLCILFCIQDPSTVASGSAGNFIVGQVFYDVFEGRFGNPVGGIIFFGLLLVMAFNATIMSMITSARSLWAFSREGGIPLHRVWAALNAQTGTPVNAVWAMTAAAFLLGLCLLAFPQSLAFNSIAIATSCLYLSAGIPMLLRILRPRAFEPGPLDLTRLQPYLNILTLALTAVLLISLLLPMRLPVTGGSLNWAPLAVILTVALALILWYHPGVNASAAYRNSARLRDRCCTCAPPCDGTPSSSAADGVPSSSVADGVPSAVPLCGGVPSSCTAGCVPSVAPADCLPSDAHAAASWSIPAGTAPVTRNVFTAERIVADRRMSITT